MIELPPRMPKLTPRQEQVLLAYFHFYEKERDWPSHRELAAALGLKTGNVSPYTWPLIEMGYLERFPLPSRSLGLSAKGLAMIERLLATHSSDNPDTA